MNFGSVCSGIEAASVAWNPLGFKAAWLAEIEPFPCALLAHHYPDVPNLGDMTHIAARVASGEAEAPDIFCGGTPCQAFSVAGLRNSLDDARGNLSLVFCEIANAVDAARAVRGLPPAVIFWENVPGVLSTKDNAFGCFLAALAGEDVPLDPAGGKWSNAGCVFGPQRTVAWRVLDAQYFGVAQRRRRVFVVASARAGFNPTEVLFEFDGVRRDSAPSRETRQTSAPRTAPSTASGGHRGVTWCAATGQAGAEISADVCPTLNCNHEAPYVSQGPVVHCRGIAQTLTSNYGKQVDNSHTALGPNIIAFDTTQVTSAANRSSPKPGDPCHPISATAHAPAIAFHVDAQPDQMNFSGHTAATLTKSQHAGVLTSMQVRRLTPSECERLQGFPDGYTLVPHRNKPAADGPRYKALGNSWAVPVVRWIGERIKAAL